MVEVVHVPFACLIAAISHSFGKLHYESITMLFSSVIHFLAIVPAALSLGVTDSIQDGVISVRNCYEL